MTKGRCDRKFCGVACQESPKEETMNQDPKIDMEFLARFVKACRYMKKSPDWHKRLLYRMAAMLLDLITQQTLTTKPTQKTWQQRLTK